MDEGNSRVESEEIDPEHFVYSSETKEADIPRATLTHLRLDSSVTEIPDSAFEHCQALAHVQLPETLKRIGKSAFGDCVNLKCLQFGVSRNASLEIPSINGFTLEDGTITVFPETMLQIDDKAFSFCKSLQKVIICSVSTKLGTGVFRFCVGLISVELPQGLQVIESELFYNCVSLTTVNIPSSVITIGDGAFFGCESLTSVDLPPGLLKIGKCSFSGCDSIETLHIPSKVSTIGRYAFSQCSSLSHIRVPSSVERIVPRAFIGGSSLVSIELPEGILVDTTELPTQQEIFLDWLIDCPSLVNLAIPTLPEDDLVASGLLHNNSRLGSVAVDDADLTRKLKHRFNISPLNKLCYYQPYHSLEDAKVQLSTLMEDDPFTSTNQVDEFGMTPLHILSLSQTPNLDMLLAVMDAGRSGHMVRRSDSFGCTPMDYLCLNRMPNSAEVVRRLFQTRFDQVLSLDRSWKSAVLQEVDEALAVDWSSRRREIGRVVRKYERKEVLSLVELCLWKEKIDEVSSKKEQILADRQRCRLMSGPAIVIPLVLPFLGTLDVEDFFVGSE